MVSYLDLTGLSASVHSPTDAIAKPTEHDIGPAYRDDDDDGVPPRDHPATTFIQY